MTAKFIEIHGAGGETIILNAEQILSVFAVNGTRDMLKGVPADKRPPINAKAQVNLSNGLGLFVTDDYEQLRSDLGVPMRLTAR